MPRADPDQLFEHVVRSRDDPGRGMDGQDEHFWLTVLHNNDGESQILNAGRELEEVATWR